MYVMQTDLRDDVCTIKELSQLGMKPVSFEEAETLAVKLNAANYVECSVSTKKGLKNVFHEAVLAVLDPSCKPKVRRNAPCFKANFYYA